MRSQNHAFMPRVTINRLQVSAWLMALSSVVSLPNTRQIWLMHWQRSLPPYVTTGAVELPLDTWQEALSKTLHWPTLPLKIEDGGAA